jgi:raffinose/stachyose/melibiose transport system substrate-binding protein
MTNDHASDLLLPTGQLPLSTAAGTSSVQDGTVLADVVNVADTVSDSNGVVPYEDWATPTFYDTITAAIQELMADRITPQEFASKVQQDYADFQNSRS